MFLHLLVNGQSYTIHHPPNRDSAIRTAIHKIPWWMFVWNSGIAVAGKLHELPTSVKLLDVGSGLGLTAMVAQRLGHHTYVTDMCKESYDYVCKNCEANGIQPPQWVDTTEDIPPNSMDYVTMCDVLYDRDIANQMIESALKCIKPKGSLIIGEPTRIDETLLLRRFDVFKRPYVKEVITLDSTVDVSEVKDDYTTINIYTIQNN
jgi:predicted nicotinamide N-methyase